MSRLVGRRLKEWPAEAALESHALLLRGGYARPVAAGIYSLLPPGLRIVRKIERIIREEMDRIGGQEVLLPLVQPRELWDESGRHASVGEELLRLKDRAGRGMVLAMTHEEAAVHLCRHEVNSHRQLPFMVYQVQTKFRDEPRPRGGLIRVREFTMKDAYSFHASQEDLDRFYGSVRLAYRRIFARAGLPEVVEAASDTGMMGGSVAHEFMLLCDAGEDTLASCPACGFLANLDVAAARIEAFPEEPRAIEKVHTPGQETIEAVASFLGLAPRQTAKAVFYDRDAGGKLVLAIVRGDIEINEAKLARIIGATPAMAGEARILAVGAVPGYASPMNVPRDACRIVVDHTVAASNNLVTGANEPDYHFRNFNLARDLPGTETADIARAREGDGCPRCEGRLALRRGIEVGNIFQLGTRYSAAMGMRFLDENSAEKVPAMGCYGIGVGRLMSSVMEARRDKFGPIWPASVAPWQIHVNAINMDAGAVAEAAERVYGDLQAAGVEVLYDDRNERAGVQFADADLLGMPFRFVVSERNLAKGGVELIRRGERAGRAIPLAEAAAAAKTAVLEDLRKIGETADRIGETEPRA